MKITITNEPDRLVIVQRISPGEKLVFICMFLLLLGVGPGYLLAWSGTLATLTCAQESGAGVVCTDHVAWLGGTRYEHVERAYVGAEHYDLTYTNPETLETSSTTGSRRSLYLQTAAGVARFSWLIHGEYIAAAEAIDAFVQAPTPAPLVVRDRLHILGVALPPIIIIGLTCVGWVILRSVGDKAVFDARDREARLWINHDHRVKFHLVRFDEITGVYVSGSALFAIRLATASDTFKLWSLGMAGALADPPAPSEADTVLATIKDWLSQQRVRLHPPAAIPGASDVIEVCHPALAYLLGHSRSAAVVLRDEQAYLNLKRLGGGSDSRRRLRAGLAALEGASSHSRDGQAYLIAPHLVAACHIDVLRACRAANPAQRQAIDALLYPPEDD